MSANPNVSQLNPPAPAGMTDDEAKTMRKRLTAFAKAKPKKQRQPLVIKNEKHAGNVIVNGEIGKAKIARDQEKAFEYLAVVNGDAAIAYLETMQRGIAAAQAHVAARRAKLAQQQPDAPKQ